MRLSREPGAPAPYQQIREILRKEILGNMTAGERIAPERDLSLRFGANRATVGRAITSLVSEGLLVRMVGRGTYVAGGCTGHRRATHAVGLLMPCIQGNFPGRIMRSAVLGLRDRGYKAVLFDSDNSTATEASELNGLAQEGLDGVLVMPVEMMENKSLFGRLIRLGHPLVFLDRKPLDLDADLVATDHFWGAYEVTSRLIRRGHTRIAHFTTLDPRMSSSVRERRMGYETALIEGGIDVDQEIICPPALFREDRYAYKHILAYLRMGERPVTAVLALNDTFAYAANAACRELGICVPDDLQIAAFIDGNCEALNELPLLRVIQRQEQIGELAVELLMSRMNGGGPAGVQTISVRPDIVDGLAGSNSEPASPHNPSLLEMYSSE